MTLSDADVFVVDDAFLELELPTKPSCLILDIRLLGMSGFEFQKELSKKGILIPIIFITGQAVEQK